MSCKRYYEQDNCPWYPTDCYHCEHSYSYVEDEMEETYFLRIKGVQNQVIEMSMDKFDESLEALQHQVGGLIEHYIIDEKLNSRWIDMWIDEESKLKGLKPTFLLYHNGELYDYIGGPCVFTKYDEEGNTYGLNDDEMTAVRDFLYHLPCYQYELRDGSKGFALVVER